MEPSYSPNFDMLAGQAKQTASSPREILLEQARQIVTQDRNSAYGNPEDNFRDIANLWSAYWRGRVGDFTPMDVAMFMVLMKTARLKNNQIHRDSLLDIAGYAACGADIQERAGQIAKFNTPVTAEGVIRGGIR